MFRFIFEPGSGSDSGSGSVLHRKLLIANQSCPKVAQKLPRDANIEMVTKIVPVRAVDLSIGPLCTEFRCEHFCTFFGSGSGACFGSDSYYDQSPLCRETGSKRFAKQVQSCGGYLFKGDIVTAFCFVLFWGKLLDRPAGRPPSRAYKCGGVSGGTL